MYLDFFRERDLSVSQETIWCSLELSDKMSELGVIGRMQEQNVIGINNQPGCQNEGKKEAMSIKKMNGSWPRIDPCGTPDNTGRGDDMLEPLHMC